MKLTYRDARSQNIWVEQQEYEQWATQPGEQQLNKKWNAMKDNTEQQKNYIFHILQEKFMLERSQKELYRRRT